MSVGGVLGGLFNALFAPLIFIGIVEYELAMLLACFLAPPLAPTKESVWGLRFDVILAGLFSLVGVVLSRCNRDHNLKFQLLEDSPWIWQLTALIVGLGIGVAALMRPARGQSRSRDGPGIAVVPGIAAGRPDVGITIADDLAALLKLAEAVNARPDYFLRILIFGVPIVLGYTFIERPLRFALGVGAILLSAAFCDIFENSVIHQERSFFGVLRISDTSFHFRDEEYLYRSLNHGTTLHGSQFFLPEEMRDQPVTYYHSTGPVGALMSVYNGEDTPPDKMNLAVIGLGTGTMACYARKGQHLTFYDIDPVVRRLSFDPGEGPFPYFTFVEDAANAARSLNWSWATPG